MDKLKFWQLIKPFRYLIIGAILSLVIFTNLGLVMPLMLKVIIDRVLVNNQLNFVFIILVTILLIYTIREIFFYVSRYMIFYISQRILFNVRTKLFRHLQNLSLQFYEEYRTGKLISNIITDVAALQQMVSASMVNLAVNLLMIVFIVGVLFVMNPILALISLVLIPLQLANFMYFRTKIKRGWMDLREKMSEISANLAETLNGVRVVKSFAKERTETRNFVSNLRPAMDVSMDVNMKGVFQWMICEAVNIICLSATIGLGSYMVLKNKMTIGSFVAFYTYLGMLINPIVQLSNLITIISQGMGSASRIIKLLDTIPDIRECENPIKLKTLKGNIKFKNVNFGYSGKTVVKDFTLDIKTGKKVALVGPSGSGKSTIANLILRFYDIKSGKILVDNHDLRQLGIESYRNHVGIVLQEAFLFSGTIAENISYGAKREVTREEIEQAGHKANLHEFIGNLENGYDTEIGENGTSLSGGQKQRVAIARAILRDPKILILDEATSALDTISEFLVQEALDNLMKDRTTIIIAHRLSTIKNADMIVVMEAGEIKQTGSHDDLIKEDGIYCRMYQSQEKYHSENIAEKDDETAEEADKPELPAEPNDFDGIPDCPAA